MHFPNSLAEFVYYRTYSRFRYDLGRREHWPETVERTINYLKEIGGDKLDEDTYDELHDALLNLRVLPSMRLVTMAGNAARRQNVSIYNCSALSIDSIDAFGEVLYLLAQGTGVGFSVESWAIERLPIACITADADSVHHYIVEDTAEGWADAFKDVITHAYDGISTKLDVSKVRPAGTVLRTKGGRASGPEPLVDLCSFAQEIIISAAKENRKLTSLEVHDICTKIGTVIVSGGVRRCLPAGTRVHTSRGSVPIEDIIVGDLVVTSQGYKPVTATWNQGLQDTVVINLEGGRTFRCTPNHRVAVLSKASGEYTFVEAQNLQEDDRLIFINTACDGVKTFLSPLPEKRKSDHGGSNVKQPEVTTETSWFLGHFFANGHVSTTEHDEHGKGGNTQFSIDNHADSNKEQIERCITWMNNHNLHVTRYGPTTSDNSVKLRSSNRQIARWMLGYKQPRQPLIIPEVIWRGTPEIRAAFIAGVMDGDGSVSGGDLRVVSTVYENFARDLMSLLSSLGIISEFHVTRKDDGTSGWKALYSVGIRSRVAQRNFQKTIGSYLCKKFVISGRSGRGYSIPKNLAKEYIPYSVYKGVWNPQSNLNSDTFATLTGVDHFTPVKVVSVESSNLTEQTYDIEVKDNHEFVAEGLLVHNSAMISLSDLLDIDMRLAKSGPFWETAPWRAMANNSVAYNKKPSAKVFRQEWNSLAESGTGERGIFNRDGATKRRPARREHYDRFLTNPCAEVVLRDGGLCNLVEVVVRNDDTLETLCEKVRLASIFGTLQSMQTNFPYLRPIWQKNAEEERLLGVSMTGQMDNPELQVHPDWFAKLKEVAIETNKEYAAKLGINQSVAVTCVKPSGTTSIITNASSGVHARWSPYYIRRIRISAYDPLCLLMHAAGAPMKPETGQDEHNPNTWVIEFPVKSPEGSIYRNDLSAKEQAEYVLMVQKYYAEHSVSATIYVNPDEWATLGHFIYENFDFANGMSFLPKSDIIYPLAPYEEIDEETYNKLESEFPEIPYELLAALEEVDNTEGSQTLACTAGQCDII